jgi:hypothetical protein
MLVVCMYVSSVVNGQKVSHMYLHCCYNLFVYIFEKPLNMIRSWGSSVSIVTDCGLDDWGSICDRGFFF